MKKLIVVMFNLIGFIIVVSCSLTETFTLKEASEFEISNITCVQVSESVYQSFAWNVSDEVYSYFDCEYIKVDFDIDREFLSVWPPSRLEDDTYVLHVSTNFEVSTNGEVINLNFYMSHNTKYMYFKGINGTYRSKNKMSSKFVKMIERDSMVKSE